MQAILGLSLLGDFGSWSLVPYAVEDIENNQRKTFFNDNSKPYVNFYTFFAILEHILRHYNDVEIIENVIYVPLSLITSRSASNAKGELRELYNKICYGHGFEVSFNEAKNMIINEFIKKIELIIAESKAKQKSVDDRVVELLSQLKDLAKKEEEKIIIKDKSINVKLYFTPIPLALTYTCSTKNNFNIKKIITYRFKNAADKLTALMLFDSAMRAYKLLSEKRELQIVVDLSHGVNYSSSSLYQTVQWLARMLRALANLDLGKSIIKIYNSDPVFLPPLDINGKNAYKIHLVRYEIIDKTTSGVGAVQQTLAEIINEFKIRKIYFNKIKPLTVKAIDPEFLKYSALATALGLPIQALYYSLSLFKNNNNFIEILNELINEYNFNSLKLKIQPRTNDNETININISSGKLPLYEDALWLIALTILYELATKKSEISHQKCANFIINFIKNSYLTNKIYGLGLFVLDYKRKCTIDNIKDDFYEIFDWLSRHSATIMINELISDNKLSGPIMYTYPIGNIDERNLLAHAGLARGAAIALLYIPFQDCSKAKSEGKKVLQCAVIADSEELRQKLFNLIK